MKFNETTAEHCRWSEHLAEAFPDWDYLWEDSLSDYQGHVKVLMHKDGTWAFYEYTYGSCSGCDAWEDSGVDITQEMIDSALYFYTRAELENWFHMLCDAATKNDFIKDDQSGLRGAVAQAVLNATPSPEAIEDRERRERGGRLMFHEEEPKS